MSEIGDKIQEKCLAFGDRIIKLNDYLLEQASKREEVRSKKEKAVGFRFNFFLLPTSVTSCFVRARASERMMQKHVMPSARQTLRVKALLL